MTPIIISLVGLALTFIVLIYKISSFATEQRMRGDEHKQELADLSRDVKSVVRRVPLIEMRVGWIEKHLDLSIPEMPETHDAEE